MAEKNKRIIALFDFDGTLADTEIVAAEVGYWLLAPYFPNASAETLGDWKPFGLATAGIPFALKIAKVDEQRAAANLESISEVRNARQESPLILSRVDEERRRLGLIPIVDMRSSGREPPTLLLQQKGDVIAALSTQSRPVPFIQQALRQLAAMAHVDYVVCTASSTSRVQACIDCAKMNDVLPGSLIHSGESDFVPAAHKPKPWVYVKGASKLGLPTMRCIAVEDSESGVGAAVNAGCGLVVGYVGAAHITDKLGHATKLLAGTRSDSGIGADIVIDKYENLAHLVAMFQLHLANGKWSDARRQLRFGSVTQKFLVRSVGYVCCGQVGHTNVHYNGKLHRARVDPLEA